MSCCVIPPHSYQTSLGSNCKGPRALIASVEYHQDPHLLVVYIWGSPLHLGLLRRASQALCRGHSYLGCSIFRDVSSSEKWGQRYLAGLMWR